MKKKTKFRLKNDLVIPFRISVCVCLAGAALNLWLFHNSFFRALSKLNETPIATITFKYKTAQRKFIDRVVWDRLQQNSPVYNGDTIHTAELSEATVWFEDGTILELAENTMAQVFVRESGLLAANLESGIATVDSSENSSGVLLTSSDVTVNVEKGTKLSAEKTSSDQNVNFSVQKGSVSLDNGTVVEAGTAFSMAGEEKTEPLITVHSPSLNEKIVNYSEKDCSVPFKWNTSKPLEKLTLVLASDRDFSNIIKTVEVKSLSEMTVNLEKGSYYWKLSEETQEVSGKFTIIQALRPQLLAPAENYSFQYRKKTPSLRFIWTESEYATAYNFVISTNPDMSDPVVQQRTSSSSFIISTLGQGSYYWQVTPYYVINRIGLANPSEVSSFTISQKGELSVPVLFTPAEADILNKRKKNITLSWKMEAESSEYRIEVSRYEDLTAPAFVRTTSENFISFKNDEVTDLSDGKFFWAVTQIDGEGNESGRSQIRSFYLIDGEIEQRTVFPPDEYVLWQPLLSDTSFTWKTNLTFEQSIQIASDSDFKNIVFESETNNTVFSGITLPKGEYWWRVRAKFENFEKSTNGKKLSVVGELNQPVIESPTASKKAIVRPEQPCSFEWQPVDGADYYRIKIYKGAENASTDALYDENFISGSSVGLNLEGLAEGYYRWEVQAYSYETEISSRRSGTAATEYFTLRKIRPCVLEAPSNGLQIAGYEAIENPPVLKWKSFEPYKEARIVVTKTSGIAAEPLEILQTSYSQRLTSLSSGTYEWTVKAVSTDDIDISAQKPHTFTVLEIPPFNPPKNAHTEGGSYFDASYIRQTPYILFKWNSVHRADAYIVEILKKKKVVHKQILQGNGSTSYKFEDLLSLAKGDFNWRVRAVTLNKNKKDVLIDGIPALGTFTISYELNTNGGKRKKRGELYGK